MSMRAALERRFLRFLGVAGIAAIGLLLLMAPPARAGVTFELRMYTYDGGYVFYTPLNTNAIPPDAPLGTYFINSPKPPNQGGSHRELEYTTNGFSTFSGGESFLDNFDSLKAQIEGVWTILVTNTTSTNLYQFTVSAPNLTSNLFPVTTISYPLQDQPIGINPPTVTWIGPTDWPVNGDIYAADQNNAIFYDPVSLPASVTNWTVPDPIPVGLAYVSIHYQTNYVSTLINASTPISTNVTADALGGWTNAMFLESSASVGFEVPVPPASLTGLTNVAHYSFEDNDLFAHDFSGHDNNIVGYGWFDVAPYMTNDAVAGSYAVGFTGSGWISPPTNLLATLGGSFSVSAWIRTSVTNGDDNGDVYGTEGIVSGLSGDWNHAVMPLGLTGSKLTFFTGSGAGGDLLRSSNHINSGSYVHVVVTRDSGSGQKKMYINGLLDGMDYANPGRLDGGTDITIGVNNGQGFLGDVDEVQFYAGVLTAAEVVQLYQNPATAIPDRAALGGHRLVAHHTFDQSDNPGQDASGQGNDISCTSTWGPVHAFSADAAAGGGALEFYGTSALCISAPSQAHTTWHNLLAGSFTFSAWVKTTAIKGGDDSNPYFGGVIFWAFNAPGNTNDTIPMSITGSKVGFSTRDINADTLSSSPTVVNDGQYHHLAVTRDGQTGEKRIYVDGNLEGLQTGTTAPLNAIDTYTIGGTSYLIDGSGTNFSSYVGLLDDVQIYDGVLSPTEVATLRANPGVTIPDTTASGPLTDALDDPSLAWSTGGDGFWFSQNTTTHDGTDAVQSGAIGDNQGNWIQTSVAGPGTLSFWWKVSSQQDFDFLTVTVDGDTNAAISGDVDWESRDINIPDGIHLIRWTYSKDPDCCSDGADAAWLDQVSFAPQLKTIGDAVDQPGLTWTPGGNAPWFYETTNTYDGVDAAQSGAIGDNQESSIETIVTGPKTVGFWWKTSCEEGGFFGGDYLAFIVDGSYYYDTISGETDWTYDEMAIPPGVHNLRWRYHRDGAGSGGRDTVWLDQVTFSDNVAPQFTEYPAGTNAFVGTQVTLSAQAYGVPAPTFQWYRNGGPISGATNPTLIITNAQIADTGNYTCVASNQWGTPSVGNYVNIYQPTDLVPLSLTAPAVIGSGNLVPFIWTATNTGPAKVSNFFDSIDVKSNGVVVGGVGAFVGYFGLQVQPASTYTLSNVLRFPYLPAGNYTLALRIDSFGSIPETNEANNVLTDIPVTVLNPDLQLGGLTASTPILGGQPCTVVYNITNNGPGDIIGASWNDDIVLSLDSTWESNIRDLSEPRYTPNIPAGGFITVTNTFPFPVVSNGTYYIVIRADRFGSQDHGDLWEVNETNNDTALLIQVNSPDLIPVRLVGPAEASPQETLPVEWSLQNIGTGTAMKNLSYLGYQWVDNLYLSTNQVAGPGSILLGNYPNYGQSFYWYTNLPAGQTMTNQQSIGFPNVPEGNYYLVLVGDAGNTVSELVETNNTLAVPIKIRSVDLAPVAITAPAAAAAHASFQVTTVVTNQGTGQAFPFWTDRLYLSTNTTYDAQDILLAEFYQQHQVAAGTNYVVTNSVTLPGVAAGTYYLLYRADVESIVLESNKVNNVLARAISIASPDLAAVSMTFPTNLASQQPVSSIYIAANVGSSDAIPSWGDRFYLSTQPDNISNSYPILIGYDYYSGSPIFDSLWSSLVPVGGSYTQQVNFSIPAAPAGDYYAVLRVDGNQAFAEPNLANNYFSIPVHVENPDLKPTNLIAPTSVVVTQLSTRIEVGWNVVNQGLGTAYPNWSDYVYISTNNFLDGSARAISSGSGSPGLAPGDSYLAFANPYLPDGIQGNFYLLVAADGANGLYETVETNNVIAKPIQIIIPPLPDLSVIAITNPAEAMSGDTIELVWTLTNRGTAAASGPFRDTVYLATAPDGSGASEFANFDLVGTIAPGEGVQRIQHISLPFNMSGTYWIIVTTDSGNRVFEFDHENNNSLLSAIPLHVTLSPTANLQVSAITSPFEAFSGQQILVTWAVTNSGTGPTRSPLWYDSVYISSTTNIANATGLATVPNAAYLAPGESYNNGSYVTLPRGIDGTYYFFVRADTYNYVFENTNENDNVRISAPIVVHLTQPPDLRTDLVRPPFSAFSGQAVQVTWGVTNHGVSQTTEGTWYDRVYISTNNQLDGSATYLGTFQHTGNLDSGQGYVTTNTVTIPVAVSGNYYFIVDADSYNWVYESPFDGNNSAAATFATTITLTPPPDLAVTLLEVPNAGLASHTFSVRYRVSNDGITTTPNNSWSDGLYLLAETNLNTGAYFQIGALNHYAPVAPGTAYTNTITATLPDGLSGNFYVAVATDYGSSVFELVRSNNLARSTGLTTITSQPADLAVTSVQGPASVEAGQGLNLTFTVTNRSNGDSAVGTWYDRVVLGYSDFFNESATRPLVDVRHDGVVPGFGQYVSANVGVSIPIDVAPGSYRLFVLSDHSHQVYEGTNENNNVSGPFPITVTRNTADLVVPTGQGPNSAFSGSPMTVQWVTQNAGNRNPNSTYWVDAVYLSEDGVLSPSDTLLGYRQNAKVLTPGTSYTNTLTATVPVGLNGNYYLIFVADAFNYVYEAGLDDNNQYVDPQPVAISPASITDLAVATVDAPADGYSGQTFDLTWVVTNAGNATASGTWYDAVYLSLDHFLDPFVDTYVGFAAHTGDVLPGQTYTNHGTFTIPQGYLGQYYVLVNANASGNVFEGGSVNNNKGFDPQPMDVHLTPPVDLVAGTITIPANAKPGVKVAITYTVSNAGSNTALGSWADDLYISADTNFDLGDQYFGRVIHKGDVLPGGSYTTNLTAALPGLIPGDYHVLLRSDILNHLVEQNRTNNLGASLDSVAIEVTPLLMGVPDNGAVAQGQSIYYRFEGTAGTTVRLRFNTGIALAGNEAYVSYGRMPTRASFDFAENQPFLADQDMFIPIANTGTYYVLVYCTAMPTPSPYTIRAEILPFTVATSDPPVAGDKGEVTFKVRGALFAPDTVFRLVNGSNSITANGLYLEDTTTAYVTFIVTAQTQGYWNLQALMHGNGTTSVLSNAVTLISGDGPLVDVAIDAPTTVSARFVQNVLVDYGNSGDDDALTPLVILYGLEGTVVGPDQYHLGSSQLHILGRSLEGPPDRLRPQTAQSARFSWFGGGLHVQARGVRSGDTRPLSEDDWTQIEAAIRPLGLADADWQAFWANVRPRIGLTWGDYVAFLQRIATAFPPEQRYVRDYITYLFTNQPGFQAASSISGVILGATNNAPQPDVGIGFFKVTTNGTMTLAGEAVTDGTGHFVVSQIQAGTYVCAVDNTSFSDFDMNQDGVADALSPTFVVPKQGDLINQTIYLHQPISTSFPVNESDATLVNDSAGVLHAFWYQDDRLWHAWNDAGTWVDGTPITTNVVTGVAAAKGGRLIDGNAPGLIVVWSQDGTNSEDLFYSVGQTNGGGGYRWSQPVQLTADAVANASPAVVVRPDGLAVITYLKYSVGGEDDSDVYYSGVNVASGQLMWNAPAPRDVAGKLVSEKLQGWKKEFKRKLLGQDLTLTASVLGTLAKQDCDASATLTGAFSAKAENEDWTVSVAGSADIKFAFMVDPDQCAWDYSPETSIGNFHVTSSIGAKNVVFRVLDLYPPTKPFSVALDDFMRGFSSWAGMEFDNSLTVGVTVDLLNGRWDKPPASTFGSPTFVSANATIFGKISFGAKYVGKENFWDNPKLNFNPDYKDPVKPRLSGSASLQISGTAQFYPEWQPKNITITPSFELNLWGWATYSPDIQPTTIDLTGYTRPPAPKYAARDTNFFSSGTIKFDPALALGTGNVYGPNSVVANVGLDLLRDGAPALALDASGVPYQIWFQELSPSANTYGSELRMADYTGSGWTTPQLIPGTKGFNSQVSAITDRLGRRMAVWVYGSTAGINTNSSALDIVQAHAQVNLYYALYENGAWSPPQPVAATDGPDSWVQVSSLTNGDVLATWTYSDSTDLVHLLVATWNGSSWSAPHEISTGNIRTPSAQQVAGSTYLLWTDSIDTNRTHGIFQSRSVNGNWSDPEAFAPKTLTRPDSGGGSQPDLAPTFQLGKTPYFAEFLSEVSDKCCRCAGKTTSVTNPTNLKKTCGVSLVSYNYTNCTKVYEYQPCPRISIDPNDIVGPVGFGNERWMPRDSIFDYTIHFENDPTQADAPAKQVTVTMPLDPNLDPRTFRLGSFGFGDTTISVPADSPFYQTTVDLTATKGYYVNFLASVDLANRQAFWQITTIDPLTGFLPLDPTIGFLPPNVTKPEGEGFVTFSIRPSGTATNGALANAKATIVFDTQPPLDTPSIFNSIEAGLPSSAVAALPAKTYTTNFMVSWSGADAPGESGLATFDIYVAQDGGGYLLWLQDTTLTEALFTGQFGVQYAFYSIAKDNAGNLEAAPSSADAITQVISPNTPPVIAGITNRQIFETVPFTLQISATDTDTPPNTLTYDLLSFPAGMSIGATNGLISWTPDETQGSTTNLVTVRVTDDGLPPMSATNSFSIIVLETNAPPQFVGTNLFYVDELTTLYITNAAVDPDVPTNKVTLAYVTGPTNATYNALSGSSGLFTWTPSEAQGPSTNLVVLQATDDASPPATTWRTNTIIVREVNVAPAFDPATNNLAPVLSLVHNRVRATDADLPTNAITYSFGPNAPVGSTLNPQSGDFRWVVPFEAAGLSNLVTIIATDDGTPPLSATQQFSVFVPHYVRLGLGATNVFSGQTSSVPLQVVSSAPWQLLSFNLDLPAGTLGGLALSNVNSPFTVASLSPIDAVRSLLSFSNTAGHELFGTQALASLAFQATANTSMSVLLTPVNLAAALTNGTPYLTLLTDQGRVVIVAEQPVLDALTVNSNRQELRLYGNPGETYEIQTATNAAPPISWVPFLDLTLSNITQTIQVGTNDAPFRIYRAVKLTPP